MIVKKAKYKKVKRLVSEQISSDIYGCDQCKKEFDDNDKLEITVFYHDKKLAKNKDYDDAVDKHQFCSWECMGKFLPKVKTDYFVSLPFLHYEQKTKGTTIKDFLTLIGK